MSERIVGRTILTLGDLYRASYFAYSLFARVAYVGVVVLCLVWLAAINIWVESETATTTYLIPALAIVIGLLCWMALIAGVFRRMSPQQLDVTYDIDRERVSVTDATGAAIIRPWSQIRSCHEHSAGFTLRLRPLGTYWLIKRAFEPAQLDAFRGLVRSIVGKL